MQGKEKGIIKKNNNTSYIFSFRNLKNFKQINIKMLKGLKTTPCETFD